MVLYIITCLSKLLSNGIHFPDFAPGINLAYFLETPDGGSSDLW